MNVNNTNRPICSLFLPRSTHALIQSMTSIGLVKCSNTPPCMMFSTLKVSMRLSANREDERHGKKPSHNFVNTARCACNECRDWWKVNLYALPLIPVCFFASLPLGSSSKYLRQSSSSSVSGFSVSSSTSPSSGFWFFGKGGFFPSSEIHQAFNSEGSVGKVVNLSMSDNRLPRICGYSVIEDCDSTDLMNDGLSSNASSICVDYLRRFSKETPPDVIMNTEPGVNKVIPDVGHQFPLRRRGRAKAFRGGTQ